MIKQLLFVVFIFGASANLLAFVAKKDTLLMGSAFNFSAVHDDKQVAVEAVESAIIEVVRIEQKISSWDQESETTKINNQAGVGPVQVSEELFFLIKRSKKISTLSNGYFDVSFESIKKVWDFKQMKIEIPTDSTIKESVSLINYKNIILDETLKTVFLQHKGMKIGFGAIGKGYAANQAKKIMVSKGIKSGVVNAGGDLTAWGKRPDGTDWTVGVADPNNKRNVISWLTANDISIVTSGSYEKYVMIDGKRYCHIINPKTGWPAKGLKSVTVITKDAEIADGLSTTIFVLGASSGLALVNKLPGVECMIIKDDDTILFSNNAKKNTIIRD
ncbi:MAG: thiamine biosynthesis lipoprotein [Glaciecola sp.]|jgi:thiamine biosynthesis lipoprotein